MDDHYTISIVDDDEAVRESTAALLKSADFEVVTFGDGQQFLASDIGGADCVLLDMRMPIIDGISVLRVMSERDCATPTIVLTGHGDLTLAVEAMKLGAVDFIQKPYEPEPLLMALRTAIANRRLLPQDSEPSPEALARVNKLSNRQMEVLRGMLSGRPNKQIAFTMGLSIRTVEAHRAQVMTRLGVRSISEAVQVALAAGLKWEPGSSPSG
jgi:two-component system, LuxR family, response regulator FixJ